MKRDNNTVIINDVQWKGLVFKQLKKVTKKYFDQYLKGQHVINLDNKAKIILAKKGWRHTIHSNIITYNDAVIFKKLNEIINKAQFDYYSKPDKSDAKTTLGFLNYKIYVIINGVKYEVKISIRIDKNGQYYYNHCITK